MTNNIYSLFLSTYSSSGTATGMYQPINNSNRYQVTWNINWSEIFGNNNGGNYKCTVRLISRGFTTPGTVNQYNTYVGVIRSNLGSSFTNVQNGVSLGLVSPVLVNTTVSYLLCDSTSSDGVSVSIPNGNSSFTISLLLDSEQYMTQMANVEYEIMLYFTK